MRNSDAIKSLSASSPHERLKAARHLARDAEPADLAALRRARGKENVSYVKAALDLAIAKASKHPIEQAQELAEESDVPADVRQQIWSQAVEWIAGLLLHEIASQVGLISRSASREIPDFSGSSTKRHIEVLQQIFNGIEQLRGAASTPKKQEVNLPELISDLVDKELDGHQAEVSFQGVRPLIVSSDPALLTFAIGNGLRNAIEAVEEAGVTDPHPIVIGWGQTDVDNWIVIIDRGPGITGPIEAAFEIGKSSKKGHAGFGLPIARQALQTLGGTVVIQPAVDGGTRYELRWEL